MPTNDFKTVADAGGANVLTQADYLALTTFLSNGFSSGIVPSAQMNKVLRQLSVMSFVLAQYIAEQSGEDVLDNGDPAAIVVDLLAAVQAGAAAGTFITQPFGDTSEKAATDLFVQRAVSAVGGFYQDTGSVVNAYVIATIPPWTAASYPNGFSVRFRTTRANTGPATLNAGTPGAFPITQEDGGPLQAGDIPTGSISTVTFSNVSNSWVYNGALPSDFLDSPAFRGIPTAPTAAPLNNSTQLSTTAYADAAVAAAVVNVAPQVINSNISASAFGDLWTDTSAGSFTITLPDPPFNKNPLNIHDVAGSWDIYNLIINSQSKTIVHPFGSVVGNLICDTRGESFRLWFDGSNWRME